jgi:hypothetical protein
VFLWAAKHVVSHVWLSCESPPAPHTWNRPRQIGVEPGRRCVFFSGPTHIITRKGYFPEAGFDVFPPVSGRRATVHDLFPKGSGHLYRRSGIRGKSLYVRSIFGLHCMYANKVACCRLFGRRRSIPHLPEAAAKCVYVYINIRIYLSALPRRSATVPADMQAVEARNHFADEKAPETTYEAKMNPAAATLGWLFGPGSSPKGAREPPRDMFGSWPHSCRVLGVPFVAGRPPQRGPRPRGIAGRWLVNHDVVLRSSQNT